jgi:2-aminoadipate transaminase
LHVPPSLRDRVLHLKQGADLNTATPIQHALASYLGSGEYERHLTTTRPRYRERRDAVHAALRHAWPRGTTFEVPSGGFYFWVEVAGVSWSELLPRALEERIAYVPGAAFCVDDRLDGHLRLAFGSEVPERLHDAVTTLGRLAAEALARRA